MIITAAQDTTILTGTLSQLNPGFALSMMYHEMNGDVNLRIMALCRFTKFIVSERTTICSWPE